MFMFHWKGTAIGGTRAGRQVLTRDAGRRSGEQVVLFICLASLITSAVVTGGKVEMGGKMTMAGFKLGSLLRILSKI